MKYKLKDVDFHNLSFNKAQLNNGIIYNIKYNENLFEFQSPKLLIESLVKNGEQEYLVLKILGTEACKTFYSKILEIESFFNLKLNNKINSVFKGESLTVKIPFKFAKPQIKIYKDDSLFNYYHLTKDITVICLLSIGKLWLNNFNELSYQIIVKEIMII